MYRSHMAGPDSDKEMVKVKWWTVSHVTGPDTDREMREAKRGDRNHVTERMWTERRGRSSY
jgi:hypothetical protein